MTALDHGNEAFSKNKHNSAAIKAAKKHQPAELCCGMHSKQEDLKRSIQEDDSLSRITDVVLVMRGGYSMAVIHSKKKIR